ncbi:hypothetical protein M1513_01060 [Patescibacteria group bacterium]|nr:hypothetical protein [Patescibacteria group bacterium]MCL5733391.1 hypothetical protein [Patescibacteria group bacterium]
MKKFFGLSVFLAALTLSSFSTAAPQICETPRKTAYKLEYQGVGFLSNLVIGLFGKSIFEDSKTFTIEESSPCQTQKELKIANPKKVLLLISQNGNDYSGTTNFKEETPLNESVAQNLFALADFLEKDFKIGDAFSMPFVLKSKNYQVTAKIAAIKSCPDKQSDCFIADVSALITGEDGEKLISIKAKIKKIGVAEGVIENIEVKTLFWPHIIVKILRQP